MKGCWGRAIGLSSSGNLTCFDLIVSRWEGNFKPAVSKRKGPVKQGQLTELRKVVKQLTGCCFWRQMKEDLSFLQAHLLKSTRWRWRPSKWDELTSDSELKQDKSRQQAQFNVEIKQVVFLMHAYFNLTVKHWSHWQHVKTQSIFFILYDGNTQEFLFQCFSIQEEKATEPQWRLKADPAGSPQVSVTHLPPRRWQLLLPPLTRTQRRWQQLHWHEQTSLSWLSTTWTFWSVPRWDSELSFRTEKVLK